MKLKNILRYGAMLIGLIGNSIAAEDGRENGDLLVIGCRPWDANIQEVESLREAHFVDFMISAAPEPVPANFYHLDVNDVGSFSQVTEYYNGPLAGKFSEFAITNPGKFNTIIIDWMTYHHIHRDAAWTDFATLLNPGGKLIIPVTKKNNLGQSISKQTAQDMIDSKLTGLFHTFTLHLHDALPGDICFDLLRRKGRGITENALSFIPAIIIATQQAAAATSIIFKSPAVAEIKGNEGNEGACALSPQAAAEISAVELYKLSYAPHKPFRELLFPNFGTIISRLRMGRSTIESSTDDFDISSILGMVIGCDKSLDTTNMGLEMKYVYINEYRVMGHYRVTFGEKIKDVFLKTGFGKQCGYIVHGGMKRCGKESSNELYTIPDPAQMRIELFPKQ